MSNRKETQTDRIQFLSWPWVLFIWVLIATISTSFLYWQLGMAKTWVNIFPVKLIVWLFWGAWAVVIFRMTQRFRLEKTTIFSGLLFHIPFSLFSVALNVLFYSFIAWGLYLIPAQSLTDFKGVFVQLWLGLFEWYYIIHWAIVFVTYAFDYYKKFRERELRSIQLEAQVIQAQLQALKMQLQPHFLFNTLNTIASLVRHEEKQTAVEMLSGLSDLLRWTLAQKDQQEITLEQELAFIEKYLELERKRFKNKFEIEMAIEPEVLQAKVPNFLLQPIVENAVIHGLSKKLTAKKLRIQAKKWNEQLQIKIFNEGNPLPNHFNINFTTGIGIANTIERLSQQFGTHFNFNLANTPLGVEVDIQIPFETYGN